MDETDLRLDGNAVAGMLAEVFGFEMTVSWGGCAGCGATNQLGALIVYAHGMGAVACCPGCGQHAPPRDTEGWRAWQRTGIAVRGAGRS